MKSTLRASRLKHPGFVTLAIVLASAGLLACDHAPAATAPSQVQAQAAASAAFANGASIAGPTAWPFARAASIGRADACGPPQPPTELTATVSGSTVTLTWWASIANFCATTSYVVEAGSVRGAADIATVNTGNAATRFVATGVPAGTYFVRLRGISAGGIGQPSQEVGIVVTANPCAVPPPPDWLMSTLREPSLTLTWSAAAGATSYVIEAGTASGASDLASFDPGPAATPILRGAQWSFTASNVAPGVYYVRVRARNGCGVGQPSTEVVARMGTSGPPPPALLTPAPNAFIRQNDPATGCAYSSGFGHGFSALFTWTPVNPVTGVTAYEIYVMHPTARLPSVHATVSSTAYAEKRCSSFVEESLRLGWEWRVRSISANGTPGPWSPTQTFNYEPCRLDDGRACYAPCPVEVLGCTGR